MRKLDDRLERNRIALKLAFGVVPVVAGLDKFFNLLTDWAAYLSPTIAAMLPLDATAFMYLVGVIEIAAGLGVLSRWTAPASLVVAAWLVMIAANLALAGFLDIAVRDIVLAIGAWTLASLSELHAEHEAAPVQAEPIADPVRAAA